MRWMAENKIPPEKGKLLISEPFLDDPYFKRSVVLITEHGEEGTIGFVLNKAIDLKLEDALPDFPKYDNKLFLGGPINRNQLYYIHTLGDQIEGSIPVMDGVYWGGNYESVKATLKDKSLIDRIRFFAGYSGWAPEQLKEELDKKSWVVTEASKEFIMNPDNENLWKEVLKGMGEDYTFMTRFPEDPSMN